MSIKSRQNGYDAVSLAQERGWTPGTTIMSAKSWVTPREIVSVESWCLRLKEVGATKTKEGGAVYKSLPKDVVKIILGKETDDRTPPVQVRGS